MVTPSGNTKDLRPSFIARNCWLHDNPPDVIAVLSKTLMNPAHTANLPVSGLAWDNRCMAAYRADWGG